MARDAVDGRHRRRHPPRVTKLNLTRRGLHGELSGLIGDLTALTELRLDFNRLTGIVPSKLQQLTGLTHFSMVANLFTGCLPASLRNVTSDDFGTPNLPLVVDLPEGYTYTVESTMGEPSEPGTPPTVVQVVGEGFSTPAERRANSDGGGRTPTSPLHEVFDRIAESVWLQE